MAARPFLLLVEKRPTDRMWKLRCSEFQRRGGSSIPPRPASPLTAPKRIAESRRAAELVQIDTVRKHSRPGTLVKCVGFPCARHVVWARGSSFFVLGDSPISPKIFSLSPLSLFDFQRLNPSTHHIGRWLETELTRRLRISPTFATAEYFELVVENSAAVRV